MSGVVAGVVGWLLLTFAGSGLRGLAQVAIVLAFIGLGVGVVLGGRRARAWVGERREHVQQQDREARRRIAPGWWVTFTEGPFPLPNDPGGRYATAIAEVAAVDGCDVVLQWRDRALLPTRVPTGLLDARSVVRIEQGARTRVQNEGLILFRGGSVTGPGWAAHRQRPTNAVWTRVADLSDDQRRGFEQAGQLNSYDLDSLQ